MSAQDQLGALLPGLNIVYSQVEYGTVGRRKQLGERGPQFK